MAQMLGPHPHVRVEVRKAKRGGWLAVQQHPVHGWEDQLAWFGTEAEAQAYADHINAYWDSEVAGLEQAVAKLTAPAKRGSADAE